MRKKRAMPRIHKPHKLNISRNISHKINLNTNHKQRSSPLVGVTASLVVVHPVAHKHRRLMRSPQHQALAVFWAALRPPLQVWQEACSWPTGWEI